MEANRCLFLIAGKMVKEGQSAATLSVTPLKGGMEQAEGLAMTAVWIGIIRWSYPGAG
jgi:hypothetical protein